VVNLPFVLSGLVDRAPFVVDARLAAGQGFCVVVAGPGDEGGGVELSLLPSPPQAMQSAATPMVMI